MQEKAIEERYCELRAAEVDGQAVITGTVMNYGSRAKYGGYTESFAPGAFDYDDVIANIQHQRTKPVARTGAGLELRHTTQSLEAVITPPNTTFGNEARELVEAGILKGLSAEFRAVKQDFIGTHRLITKARLFNLAIVDRPAYDESTIAKRFADLFEVPTTKRYFL